MKELNDIVTAKTSEMINDGTIEGMIAKTLEHTIESGIQDAMKSYSDFGKAIKEKIEVSIQQSINGIEIPLYNKFIQEVVNEKFIEILNKNAVDQLAELIEGVIAPVSKTAKFSDVIYSIEELWADEGRACGRDYLKITTEENEDGTALYVKIHHPQYDFNTVKVSFYNFNRSGDDLWHIGYINENDTALTGKVSNSAKSHIGEVVGVLFKYYAMGTKFERDCEFEDIGICDY